MCDLNWCPVCDKAISNESDFLYCSISCFLKENSEPKDLTYVYGGFLCPRTHNIDIHVCHDHHDSVPELTSSLSTKTSTSISDTLSTIDAFFSSTKEEKSIECCDYCKNTKNQWDPFEEIQTDRFVKETFV